MKRRVSGLIKHIIAALSSKTNELRTRIMIFFLLHRNQSMLLQKFQTAVAGRRNAAAHSLHAAKDGDVDCPRGGEEESFVIYMNSEPCTTITDLTNVVDPTTHQLRSYTREKAEESSVDLTSTLLKESEAEMKLTHNAERMNSISEDMENNNGRMEEGGEEDIDHAADLFIERFRRQIRLQKQLSLQERRQMQCI